VAAGRGETENGVEMGKLRTRKGNPHAKTKINKKEEREREREREREKREKQKNEAIVFGERIM
jgi:hypothetical protein